MWGRQKMECGICKVKVYATNTGKEPRAFFPLNAKDANDFRCVEHKNQQKMVKLKDYVMSGKCCKCGKRLPFPAHKDYVCVECELK